MPARYARHYYDLYQMAGTLVKTAAFCHPTLLNNVVDFKMKFYPRGWAKYEQARPGSLRLVPPDFRIATLREDYLQM